MAAETKKERFKRVAEKRVQNIINGIRSLAQLSNRKVYDWEARQLEKIWKTLEQEIENCKGSYTHPETKIFKL
jgi:predicted transcriptional regulator